MLPDVKLLDELKRRITEVVQPLRIIMFGSAARGEMSATSDLDVLVVVPQGTNCRQVSRAIYVNLIGFAASADVVVTTDNDLSLHGDNPSLVFYPALREGVEIYAS